MHSKMWWLFEFCKIEGSDLFFKVGANYDVIISTS